ncbi:MAG: universal stress protein [Bacteroidetes bacterium]|nr:universal stress protein [Bacteroidota bacterium]
MKNKIIVPTDLTEAGHQAVRQAISIANKGKIDMLLLHILDEKSPSAEEVQQALENEARLAAEQSGRDCQYLIKEGTVFETLPNITCESDFCLMVIATHGIRGIRQKLTGPDILKLVAKLPLPVLVVPEQEKLIDSFDKIILPVSSHDSFQPAIDAILFFSRIFNSEIHLYSVYKPGFEWPKQLMINVETATEQFGKNGVRLKRIKEDQTIYSLGYAKQTMKYAEATGADSICIMSTQSQDYYYFAQSDKETIVLNELNLPILCVGGGK